jgi:hypothetical protein
MSNLVVVTQEENPSFLKDKIQLQKLLKDLNKASKEALEILVNIMETTKDEKLKAQCAKDILQFTIATNKEVNADQMQRLIAEIKLNRAPQGKLIPLNDPEDVSSGKGVGDRPVVDFSTVRSLE